MLYLSHLKTGQLGSHRQFANDIWVPEDAGMHLVEL